GTRRRLQALVAIGWPFSHIARHIGMHQRPLAELARAQNVTRRAASTTEANHEALASDLVKQNRSKTEAETETETEVKEKNS
ncbi:hypothetical protein KBZ21_40475, partial [Streptomyces sp. A73]|nr:hypothetical protein [Streptomyces sp. A73]